MADGGADERARSPLAFAAAAIVVAIPVILFAAAWEPLEPASPARRAAVVEPAADGTPEAATGEERRRSRRAAREQETPSGRFSSSPVAATLNP